MVLLLHPLSILLTHGGGIIHIVYGKNDPDIYKNLYSLPIIALASGLFILVDFYTDAGTKTGLWHRPVYWALGWIPYVGLMAVRAFIENQELRQQQMEETISINETLIAELNEVQGPPVGDQ